MKRDLDPITEEIIKIYNALEAELLIDVARRFDVYDKVGGTLEWHLAKLDELGALDGDLVKTISKYSSKAESEIQAMLRAAGYANIDFKVLSQAFQKGLISDPQAVFDSDLVQRLINNSYKQYNGHLRLIQTKARESAKKAYMDILNASYIEVSSGTYDFNSSVRRAIQRMGAKGITGATYSRGGTVVNYSIEGTVRRDTLTAVNQLANNVAHSACLEMGAQYVEISSHLGARTHRTNPIANHAGWQGKVFRIEGADEYPNLKLSTGYPGDIQGLGGVNCRHRMFPFFPGISTPNPIQYSERENRVVYELTQEQRAMERKMRQLKKMYACAKASNDDVSAEKLSGDISMQDKKIQAFCDQHGFIRDYSRENIQY